MEAGRWVLSAREDLLEANFTRDAGSDLGAIAPNLLRAHCRLRPVE